MFKKKIFLTIVIGLCISAILIVSGAWTAISFANASPPALSVKGDFPITGWFGPPSGMTSFSRYREVAELGFTHTMHGWDVKDYNANRDVLEQAERAGIGAIVFDERLYYRDYGGPRDTPEGAREALDNLKRYSRIFVREYSRYDSLVGFILADEPCANRFDLVAELNDFIRENFPDVIPYINLFPNYASPEQLGVDTYEEYVDLYIQTVDPVFISFDFYPFVGEEDAIVEGFYSNLELIRTKSLEYDLPFWAFVQSCAYGNRRNPDKWEIRWQVYQNLAYGAKGIQYFVYWTPPWNGRESIREGIIDARGRRTEHYETVRQINRELNWIGDTLLDLKSKGVYHSGDLPEELGENYEPEWLEKVLGDDVVIGVFSDINENTYMLVTNSCFSTEASVEIGIKGDYDTIKMYDKTEEEIVPLSVEEDGGVSLIKLELQEGDGILLKLE